MTLTLGMTVGMPTAPSLPGSATDIIPGKLLKNFTANDEFWPGYVENKFELAERSIRCSHSGNNCVKVT